MLLPDAERSQEERFCLGILALQTVEVCQTRERIGYLRMLRPQLPLPNPQCSQEERLRLGILTLIRVEVCQVVEQTGYQRMLRSYILLPDPQCSQEEWLRLRIACTSQQVGRCLVDQTSCLPTDNLIPLDDLHCCQCLW